MPQFSSNYTQGPTYDPGSTFGGNVFNYGPGEQYHYYGYETWGYGYTPTLTLNLPRNKIVIGGNATWGGLWSREYWWGTPNIPMVDGFNDAWDEWDTRILASAYVQDEIAVIPDTLFITPGVKFIYAHTSDKDHVGFFYPITGTVNDDEHYVSPTVGLSYKPVDGVDIYAAFGQNIKFPDISAYYGAFQTDINGNNIIAPVKVAPEYVNDYELGARFERGGFFASIDLYREDFTHTFITVANLTSGIPNGTTSVSNGGNSVYQGVELQLKETVQWMDADWSGYFNYAHNQAKFTTSFSDASAGAVLAGTPVANVPQDLISAGLDWSRSGWAANVDLRYVGRQFTDQNQLGTSPTPNTIPSYVVVDLGASKTFHVAAMGPSGAVKLGINVDNLFDQRYFNEAFTDTDNMGNSFLRPVVAAPLSVTGSVTATF
ncbi:MAG TPA: TonB-dependent receptor [Caulobacteraceae bacterium]|nr:TonB-dependent receptor [Caulobacteraceae bacterium]